MRSCTSILAREYWLDGRRQNNCSCLFLSFDDGCSYKVFFDDGDDRWRLVETVMPQERTLQGEKGVHFPHRQYLPAYMEAGYLQRYSSVDHGLLLGFSSGLEISLSHDAGRDVETMLVILPGGKSKAAYQECRL